MYIGGDLPIKYAYADDDVRYTALYSDEPYTVMDVIFSINDKLFMLIVDEECSIADYWLRIKELAGLDAYDPSTAFWTFTYEGEELQISERFKNIVYQAKRLLINCECEFE